MEIKRNSGLFILARKCGQNEISTAKEANEPFGKLLTFYSTSQLEVKRKGERQEDLGAEVIGSHTS